MTYLLTYKSSHLNSKDRLMKANLNLGKYFGTEIQIHWTFFLLIVWVIVSEIINRGAFDYGLFDKILFNFELVIAIMICVFLHEMGHLLAAKKFGIKTERMVILPIGGISTQHKSTESPKEELLITLAGPLVNIVIALILYFAIPVNKYVRYDFGQFLTAMNDFSVQTFLFYVFIANIVLVLFNLIPAFPLDGGRILRAFLDVKLDRAKATSIATTIGNIIAITLILIGLSVSPILVLMGIFLFIGGYSENKSVHQLRILKGFQVRDAMLKHITVLDPDDTMEDIVRVILSGSETNFVVEKDKTIVGLLYHNDIIQNSGNRTLQVRELMVTTFKTVQIQDKLSSVYALMQDEIHPFFPVMEKDKLIGAIDFANLNEFMLMEARLKK